MTSDIINKLFFEIKLTEILCEAEWLSVDPYMRGLPGALAGPDATMPGSRIARFVGNKSCYSKIALFK